VNILEIDQQVFLYLNSLLVGKSAVLDALVKFSGIYLIYGLPVILLALWFLYPAHRKELFLSLIACLFSWFVVTKLAVPSIWFRARPDLALIGAKELLFHRPDYSFPSDHATALFAFVFGLYAFGWRRAAGWFLAYTLLIVTARVALGTHFPLDIIAGAVSALIGVLLIKLLSGQAIKYLYSPLIWLLQKVRLA